ncbi:MAG TPA: type IX secretion system protein PorQ [Salinivirgaceae bacterium]|nr:type IX secretion system protein PorQ [Salinivirgaceae bacterium]
MSVTKIISAVLIVLAIGNVYSQSQFTGTYRSYELPQSPRIVGLGGKSIAISDNDLSLSLNNPSLLKAEMSNAFFVNASGYGNGINYGNVLYARHFQDRGNFAIGLLYLDYGDFRRMDEFGYDLGEFTGNEYIGYLIWSKELFKNIHIGATAKPIYSKIETYTSYGAAFDLGIHYTNPTIGTTFSVVGTNIGRQIKPYVNDAPENLPYDIQVGFSTKLQHAPFRFSFMFYNLTHKSLLYSNHNVSEPNNTNMSPEEIEKDYVNDDLENFLRHMIFGFELIPSKAFYLQFGYNFLRRSELKTIAKPSLVGVSLGLGIRVKKIQINYSFAQYHLAHYSNNLSLQFNLHDIFQDEN